MALSSLSATMTGIAMRVTLVIPVCSAAVSVDAPSRFAWMSAAIWEVCALVELQLGQHSSLPPKLVQPRLGQLTGSYTEQPLPDNAIGLALHSSSSQNSKPMEYGRGHAGLSSSPPSQFHLCAALAHCFLYGKAMKGISSHG